MRVVVGIAAGLGNGLFLLPMMAALRGMGHYVTGYVDGDYQSELLRLWRRCVYLNDMVDGPHQGVPSADAYVSGHWCPRALRQQSGVRHYRFTSEPNYPEPEWALAFRAAYALGYPQGKPAPVVHQWCKDLRREPQWDVGVIQGSKPGAVWARKRYHGMSAAVTLLREMGRTVAVFGTPDDPPAPPGTVDLRGKYRLDHLPEGLASCRVVLGTDSGPTHLAASLGIPTVFVFTATSAVKGAPVSDRTTILQTQLSCQPCQATARWAACAEWRCQHIDPVTVARSTDEAWRSG